MKEGLGVVICAAGAKQSERTQFSTDPVHHFTGADELPVDFRYTKNLGFGVLPTQTDELVDELLVGATFTIDDGVVSEVRHTAAMDSTSSICRTCFIDEDIFDLFHCYKIGV